MKSVLQFIPKVISGFQVSALGKLLEFFHSKLDKPYLFINLTLHTVAFVMLGQVFEALVFFK